MSACQRHIGCGYQLLLVGCPVPAPRDVPVRPDEYHPVPSELIVLLQITVHRLEIVGADAITPDGAPRLGGDGGRGGLPVPPVRSDDEREIPVEQVEDRAP
jgi:hypothetical protein